MKTYQCAKVTLLASMHGYTPQLAVEFGRKVLFSTERPSFTELDDACSRRQDALTLGQGQQERTSMSAAKESRRSSSRRSSMCARRRPPWWRLEDRVCRLHDGHVRVLPGDVAALGLNARSSAKALPSTFKHAAEARWPNGERQQHERAA
jgi:hypothetical protein